MLSKPEIKRNFLNLLKGTYEKPTDNIIFQQVLYTCAIEQASLHVFAPASVVNCCSLLLSARLVVGTGFSRSSFSQVDPVHLNIRVMFIPVADNLCFLFNARPII